MAFPVRMPTMLYIPARIIAPSRAPRAIRNHDLFHRLQGAVDGQARGAGRHRRDEDHEADHRAIALRPDRRLPNSIDWLVRVP